MSAEEPSAASPFCTDATSYRDGVSVTGGPRAATAGLLRVPQVTAFFWLIKGLSTAMGEATSDFLVHAISPVLAVLLGFVGFLVALWYQLSRRRYVAVAYWTAVVMVGIFGTMAADVLHVGFHVPYLASSILYALCLAAVFATWKRSERTLSIHEINSLRRESFYWAAVVATFAAGTAVGDLAASTLHLGYGRSLILFVALILVTVLVFATRRMGAISAFWTAYVLTRPLGASIADYLAKPRALSGRGIGDGPVCLVLVLAIAAFVTLLSVTKLDVQGRTGRARRHAVRTR
jgi:uncharacterized membrane-anchored protein